MPAPILAHLLSCGLSLRLEGDRLVATPGRLLTDETRRLIQDNRAALVDLLSTPGLARLDTLARQMGIPLARVLDWYGDPGERAALAAMPLDQARAIVGDWARAAA